MVCADLRNKQFFSLCSIKDLGGVMEMVRVYCAVQTEHLNIIQITMFT
jgi:hypothetical protein